eukprot:snap_masked-scaffold_1-processed-gene-22.23-mRNA-1 protein AED:1.00 eAED:1.00 QI:0/-1/0/0/-1/1/1/0/83
MSGKKSSRKLNPIMYSIQNGPKTIMRQKFKKNNFNRSVCDTADLLNNEELIRILLTKVDESKVNINIQDTIGDNKNVIRWGSS